MMKVSIITVVYNGRDTIRDAIESVLSQDYDNVEYIVVDGASRDGTTEVVKSYGERISKFISEPDKGIYDAMNKGVGLATGDVVGILNADDFYNDNRVLTRVVEKFQASACEGVYGDLEYINPVDTKKVERYWKAGVYVKNSFLLGWMPPHPSFFVKRDVYERLGTFNTELRSAADYEIMLRFIHKHGILLDYIPEVLVKMRSGGQSNISVKNRLKGNWEDKLAWKLNGLKPFFFTTWIKPLKKVSQFFIRKS